MAKKEIVNKFGKRLNDAMNNKGINAPKLADKLGYKSASTVYDFVNSRKEPRNLQDLINIANALSCSTDYLLGLDDAPTHEAASVCKQTGLNEEAVAVLKRANDMTTSDETDPVSIIWSTYIITFINDLLTFDKLNRLAKCYCDWKKEATKRITTDPADDSLSRFLKQYYYYDQEQRILKLKKEYAVPALDGKHLGQLPEFITTTLPMMVSMEGLNHAHYVESGARHEAVVEFESFLKKQYRTMLDEHKDKGGMSDDNE